ncbi:MAG: glycogen debranching N-terminal domain-containing protein [Microcella sp.]|uniref:glycogen debranching N-terminal domain-containing protein n=1 Tax=Microcella sp. TaxID=1913979 RepID=UPI00271EA34C|nr:glycogen debranching N-terminal domain-containing protein [Microcella sp.]MDO8337867.1 glycogen debranching N-terminal domain-containing protein [Microcella sp.]
MTAPLQPLLHDALAVLRAPTQVWSGTDGSIGSSAIHGVYFSDVRLVRGARVRVGGADAEHLSTATPTADRALLHSLLRHLDDPTPDPGVRLEIERLATVTGWSERLTIVNRRDVALDTAIEIELDLDARSLDEIKQGHGEPVAIEPELGDGAVAWVGEGVSARLRAEGFEVERTATGVRLRAALAVPARGSASRTLGLEARDSLGVISGASQPVPWSTPEVVAPDSRLTRWVERSLADLDCLRMTTAQHPDRQFLAAGAPWFFTLFGRDSLWAARFLLPLGTDLARDTLHVLAGLQGTAIVDDTAEEPGKIMHELRRQTLVIDDGTALPPLYYGTVDATALWVCLLHDAWRWGMADDEVRALLPALRGALAWMRDHGDADGDGLLEYVDRSGHGLANQGWKDSGDSVQWRDGSLAEGPIALCEVQAYAYEAAVHGAELLEALGDGADDATEAAGWRDWAERLKTRFHESFWIDDPAGAYPAIALDAAKRKVDTVTSNLGHLLGTGLLDAAQSELVARRLGSPAMSSGYGLRTMSTESSGYWPLSYHGGSVWTHDTAIAVLGLARDGHEAVAAQLIDGLLAAAEGFDYRMPELHSGDDRAEVGVPVPYPAACRPQAWSAASAVAVLSAALRLNPDARGGAIAHAPLHGFEHLRVAGLRLGAASHDIG